MTPSPDHGVKSRRSRDKATTKKPRQKSPLRKSQVKKAKTATKTPLSGTESGVCLNMKGKEKLLVLGRPGSDLLSQGLSHSTIGAEEFNGRVRDGIGFKLLARTTRPAKDEDNEASLSAKRSSAVLGLDPGTSIRKRDASFVSMACRVKPGNDIEVMDTENESNQADRTISTGKLHALL